MCLAQGPQRSDAREGRTRGPLASSQPLRSQMIHIVISVNKEWMILTVVSLIEELNGPYCDLSEEWMIHTETPFRKGWMFLTVISVS